MKLFKKERFLGNLQLLSSLAFTLNVCVFDSKLCILQFQGFSDFVQEMVSLMAQTKREV